MEKSNKKEYILEYDLVYVNILSIIVAGIMIGLTVFLCKLFPKVGDTLINVINDDHIMITYAVFFVVMILWMVLHEIIHSIGYQVMGAKKENIVFGAALEKGVFYCKCKEYINKKCIMVSLLSPLVIIGILTYILGFIINSSWLIFLSIINISGAAGDIMMFNFFRKQKDDVEFKEMGFSSPFCLRTSDELVAKKFRGIKSIREVTDPKETIEAPEKKITISKASWVFIIGFLALLGLMVGLQVLLDKKVSENKVKIEDKNEELFKILKDYEDKTVSWNVNEDNIIKEFPELTFGDTSNAKAEGNILVKKGDEERRIIYGCPIISTYKYDLTGDGNPEIIANVMFGYGMIDAHIEVYDLYNDKMYSLWDRGEYDYYLYYIDNEFIVIKANYGSDISYIKGTLNLVVDENHEDGGYLMIENEKEI